MREWFKLGFVYSIHNTNMVKIVWVGLEQASQYITIAIIFCAMGVVTIALYPPSVVIPWIQIYGGNRLRHEFCFKPKIENRFGIFVVEKRQVEGFSYHSCNPVTIPICILCQ